MSERIPPIPLELKASIRTLVHAAYLLRGFFVQVAEGVPVEQILEEQGALLDLADRTLDLWGAHLGLEVGGLLDVRPNEEPRQPAVVKPVVKTVSVPLTASQGKKDRASRVSASLPFRQKRKGPSGGHL